MSGHSKWATTKRKKAVIDAKKSANFTKLANIITISAKEGGDPDINFKLRMAIDKAKSSSMPKENIDRAVKRGTGELSGNQIEEMVYEGFGSEGIALVIEIVTDNKNRASSNIKHALAKHGGNLGGPGSTMWMFERKGVMTLETNKLNEELQLTLIDAGADDIQTDENVTITTSIENFEKVKAEVEKNNLTILDSGLEYMANDLIKPTNEERLVKMFEELEECDDVSNYYSNADF